MAINNINSKEIEKAAKIKADTFLANAEKIRVSRNIPLKYMKNISAVYPSGEMSFIDAIIISQILGIDFEVITDDVII